MSEINHNALAIKARSDESAFTELYSAHIDQIFGFVMKRIGHKETCEDIVSEVFRKVFLHLETYDPKKASFRVWLYRIATNTLTDHYRSQRNPTKGSVVDIDDVHDIRDEDASPHSDLLSQEQKDIVRAGINALPENYQKILQLKFFEDLPNQEIAAILEINPNNVGVLIHRAQKKLKGILEQSNVHI